MSSTLRTALSTLSAVPLALALPGAALAAPVQHDVYVEQYDGTEPMPADENVCGSWAATFSEQRAGEYKLVVMQDGKLHVNGVVDGTVRVVPTDSSLPTYTGTYREKLNGIITGVDEQTGDDTVQVAQYRLRIAMTGTDGSTLVLSLAGKTTVTPKGDVVVERDALTCSPR